ncbi:hypothetical protein G6F55_013656 [Rhizopus delemar]|uniref:Uncharacterized protein n=1 Tax=Rhizopus oryzae TaxID=64495 RepID=A0A9P7BY63_RHIOR|nr:hypothetical protein G6F55_013656 [Rhizopus delemar]KAG1492253.1 hypothetical protein G6F52_013370 [Rhizopus delemar]KAG1524199.1 hypothetical protein G6F51_014449 [Rhizopus arrhizus]KAG1607202.1 hypothetical protein G6F45_013820 [Rhizopus arrhizus]
MVKEDQVPNTSIHGETDMYETNMEEASNAMEDTAMTNAEEATFPIAVKPASNDDKPIDAVMGLRVTLEDLRQQIG